MPYEPNLYDSHMHTTLCKHARAPLTDYAAQAEREGAARHHRSPATVRCPSAGIPRCA